MVWKDLFSKHTFFTNDYKYYLCINAASRTQEAQQVWSGFVESKVRLLVGWLELEEAIDLVRPYNKGFDRVHDCQNEDDIQKVIDCDMSFQRKDSKTETTDTSKDPAHIAAAQGEGDDIAMQNANGEAMTNGSDQSGPATMYTTTYYLGLELSKGLFRIPGGRID